MKKTLVVMCIVLLLAALAAGCASAPKTEPTAAPTQQPTAEPAPEPAAESAGMYILCSGTKLTVGMQFADVKDGLGAETRPVDVILPCDGGDAYKDTIHYFGTLAVTEDKDGVIAQMEISDLYETEGDAALMGKIKVGSTQAEAIAALGEPSTPMADDDYALTYDLENGVVLVFLSPDDNKETVSGINIMWYRP